jgi:hypothetical protein
MHTQTEHSKPLGGKHMNIFPPMTEEQVFAQRVGTPAYQMIHPYNTAMKAGVKEGHYATLVQPTMSKKNASMMGHLGMLSTPHGGKNNGSM